MRTRKLHKRVLLTTLKIAALAVILGIIGSSVGVSQEEDVCASVFDPEVVGSTAAYQYCNTYCVQLDCAGTPADEDVEQCLALLDQYAEITGGGLPSCEVQ